MLSVQPPNTRLLDPIQPRAVHSNLIIHLISLARNALNMLVLRVDFLAHGATEVVEALSCTVEGICITH
jgi:hypothetical protein